MEGLHQSKGPVLNANNCTSVRAVTAAHHAVQRPAIGDWHWLHRADAEGSGTNYELAQRFWPASRRQFGHLAGRTRSGRSRDHPQPSEQVRRVVWRERKARRTEWTALA